MKSFEAKIFVGFKERNTGIEHTKTECWQICAQYADQVSTCVTLTDTYYIYKNGSEPGAIIGFIQYPRFPEEELIIKNQALDLAEKLMLALNQYRVTINFPDEVVMLSNPNLVN